MDLSKVKLADLKQLVREYDLHTHIKGFNTMKKSVLIGMIEKFMTFSKKHAETIPVKFEHDLYLTKKAKGKDKKEDSQIKKQEAIEELQSQILSIKGVINRYKKQIANLKDEQEELQYSTKHKGMKKSDKKDKLDDIDMEIKEIQEDIDEQVKVGKELINKLNSIKTKKS
jgi:predicted RNase H-like nuclease (RuvC/YqgF family)